MSAHLRPIHVPKCQTCGGRATERLYNTWNAELGDYCGRHARAALQRARDAERRELPPR